ncbi:MAG: 6-phosphogluconate dehydrogenase [Bacteroidia bacterium]|nr:6-phosphogluconate dehydrogenase [Bacteroidia bacterium]
MNGTPTNIIPINIPTLWQRIKKSIVRFTLITLAVMVLIMSYFILTPYSQGMRAGTLIKLSKKGYLFKTWEGELSQPMNLGDQSTAALTSKLWGFSVNGNNEALVNQLNEALLSGRRIKLNYEEKYIVFSWQGETKYFITSAEVSK